MSFNPNDHKPEHEDGKYLQQPGDFLVAFTRYNGRETNNNSKEFLKMSGIVIGGEPTSVIGKRFTQRVYITKESYGRIGAMCAAMGWNEEFKLSEDDDVRRVFLKRPFKAKFKTESRDGKTYAGIAFFEHKLTDEERAVMDEWVANAAGGMDDDAPPPPSDNDAPSGDTDDIPF